MEGLVSIIVPVYNREDVVRDCIRSAQKQSYGNFELLLIDDASTDGSAEICQQSAREDERITLIRAEHGGISATRNIGLERARGEFVFFLDSDDAIHPAMLEALVGALQTHNAGIAGSVYLRVEHSHFSRLGTHIRENPGPGRFACHTWEDALNATIRGGTPLSQIGGVMMRRSLIGSTRFRTDLHIGEDFWFIYENLLKGPTVCFLEQAWYYARQHTGNISRDFSYEGFYSRFLRRKLVWESEEALGRPQNAQIQKMHALFFYMRYIEKNQMSPADRKKMQQVMKAHKKDILPALNLNGKLRFRLYVPFPGLYRIIYLTKKKLGFQKEKENTP